MRNVLSTAVLRAALLALVLAVIGAVGASRSVLADDCEDDGSGEACCTKVGDSCSTEATAAASPPRVRAFCSPPRSALRCSAVEPETKPVCGLLAGGHRSAFCI